MTETVAGAELRQFIERIERIEEEVRDLNRDKSDIYQEAKGRGFEPKAMKKIVAKRRMNPQDREELEALVELYEAALGTEPATHVHAHGRAA